MVKSSAPSSASDPPENKHEQKLQAVLLADSFSNAFHPVTLEPYADGGTGNGTGDGASSSTTAFKGRERPLTLCPLNNVPLLRHTIDFLQGSGVEELFVLCTRGADAIEGYIRACTGVDDVGGRRCGGDTPGGGLEERIAWSSKLTIITMRFTDCANAGDALRELDLRNVIKSDPFILMQGDIVTNVDLREAMEGHEARRKKDAASIMTVLLQEVGGWGLDDATDNDEEGLGDNVENPNSPNDHLAGRGVLCGKHQLPPLRSSTDDLVLALDTTHSNRILLWDSCPGKKNASIPAVFFAENSANITLTRNYLDVGIDICSPDVLARFSDAFDYRELRSQFVADSVVEEEVGLQSRIFAYMLKRGEYAGRAGDPRRYHNVSMDLLKRWCYPLVPDNYASAGYVCERHFVYRDVGVARNGSRSHVGRSTQLLGPLLLGPNNSIGERCLLRRSVLGPNCTVMDGCAVVDSHLWGGVLVEEGARLNGVIACEGSVIRSGAVLEKGCVVGRGCIIGEGVHLKEFTRVTCVVEAEADDEDDYRGIEDSSSSCDESESSEESSDDDGEGSDGSYEKVTPNKKSPSDILKVNEVTDTITNHEIMGKDGLGRVYVPSPPDDYDSDSDEEEEKREMAARTAAFELMKSQSIGYDMALTYKKWREMQMEDEDDGFSLDGMSDSSYDENIEGEWGAEPTAGGGINAPLSHLDNEGMHIEGRQRGIDVVSELRDICLEHEMSCPVENLRIELNSFKFSQNATYCDCARGATAAVVGRILEEEGEGVTPGRLVSSLKKSLEYWAPLFQSICMGSEEERAIIYALEAMATSSLGSGNSALPTVAAVVLSKEPAFRFVLQTLHDREVLNEEAISKWAAERREEGDREGPIGALFWQVPTQDFLEWLEEDSDSSDSGGDSSEDADSAEDSD